MTMRGLVGQIVKRVGTDISRADEAGAAAAREAEWAEELE